MLKCHMHFTAIFMFWKTFRVNVSKYQIYEAAEIEKSTYPTCMNGWIMQSIYKKKKRKKNIYIYD